MKKFILIIFIFVISIFGIFYMLFFLQRLETALFLNISKIVLMKNKMISN